MDRSTCSEDSAFDAAVDAAERRGQANGPITGIWLDRRHRAIGVGIRDGDEIETTEALRALVPPGIAVRTRVASPRMVELWQLQADVYGYLDDEGVWGRWAVSLGVDPRRELLQVGLLDGTPDRVVERIHARFPGTPLVIVTAGPVIALSTPTTGPTA